MLKIMSLNLWRYYDWDVRKDYITSLIQEQAPDFIALQEVLTNHAFSDFPQSDFIADACGYPFWAFGPTLLRMNSRDKEGNRNQQASEGQACISKYPILATESYFLRQHPGYAEDVSVQFCSLDVNGETVELCNVHFANNDVAYKQLDELLELIEMRGTTPIILGDFNIYKLAEYKATNQLLKSYRISSEVADYVSFPRDGESLDYIAVPNSKYVVQDVVCPDTYVSDHKALLATVTNRLR